MRAWLAQGIARRPALFLAAALLFAAGAVLLGLGSGDRLVVGGGLERGTEIEENLELTLTPRGTLTDPVAREALTVIESGLVSDPAIVTVARESDNGGDETTFLVVVQGDSAAELATASERVADRVDPGPFELEVAGETRSIAEARAEVENELPRLLLLALPFVLLVIGLGFGLRLAIAPTIAAAAAGLGGIAALRLLPAGLDLTSAGIAVAAAVGVTLAIEICAVVGREHRDVDFDAQEAMLADTLGRTLGLALWAAVGAAVAAAAVFGLPFPSARSAAIGGIAAALLAGVAAPIAIASVIALVPPRPPEEPQLPIRFVDRLPLRMARLVDEIALRPVLAWIPALLGLAVLVIAAYPALDLEAVALTPSPGTAADEATELLRDRIPWILGGVTVAGLVAVYLATRSLRLAVARGIAVALPAGAACGLLAYASEGSLPVELEAAGGGAYAGAFFVALAALGAVGVARAVLGDRRGAVCGTLIAAAGFGVLAGVELDAIAQTGIIVATGLVIDLALVQAMVAPCLERALPERRPSVPIPILRLPDRFRR